MITALNGVIASGLASIPLPPSNTLAPVISGTNVVGNTLTTTNGTWSGTLPITYTYQWKRNGSNIVGATASTYLLVQADATFDITCSVTGTNILGNSTATSNALTIFDANAQLFIDAETAAGEILSTTQKNAVNQWVADSKSAAIWTKMKAVYPIVGGTATAHKFNLINPADTNAAYRLSFVGGWTHSSTGMLPNGINTYAQTYFTPSSILGLNNVHISHYSRTDNNALTCDIGSQVSGGTSSLSMFAQSTYNMYRISDYTFSTVATLTSKGFKLGTRLSSTTKKMVANSLITDTLSSSTGIPNQSILISAHQDNGAINYYSYRECAFASIGDGLTDLESQLFYQITEKFQVALGRNVNAIQSFYYNSAYNNETNAFLFSTQITDNTIQTATNTLVTDLKTANIFTKIKALYPMVGGTATTCKFNLANAQDTDAAFRLTFAGGWTYSSDGALPNGVNSYANTFLSSALFTGLPLGNNAHLSFYSRTNSVSAAIRVDLGSLRPTPDSYSDLALGSQNQTYFRFNNGISYNNIASTNTLGFYTGSRTATNIIKTYKNGAIIINGTAVSSSSSGVPFFVGASNNNGTATYFSDKQCAFASLGDGLTDLESQLFYQIVEKFQVALGRNINAVQSFYYNTAYNNETNAFLFSTQITNTTIQTATNTLVTDLKTANIFTKIKALYPMVGGTATTHKFNLINSQDTDAAYRLAFVGGWTHSSNGALPNGTNAYAETYLAMSVIAQDSGHMTYYSRSSGAIYNNRYCMGFYHTPFDNLTAIQPTVSGVQYGYMNSLGSGTPAVLSAANTLGFLGTTRLLASGNKTFKNTSISALANQTSRFTSATTTYYIGSCNVSSTTDFFGNFECALASIGDGLTDAEVLLFRTAAQNFNTTLGRQV